MAATSPVFEGHCELHYNPPFQECVHLSKKLTPSALGLQLLVVRGKYFKKKFAKLSRELVWLRWFDFPHERLPSWLLTEKLRVLELYRSECLAELWGPNDSAPSQLRELIIDMSGYSYLKMIPTTIGLLRHLKKIVLRVGQNEISSLPEEFCLLESLEHLKLLGFSSLSSLPIHFGNLRKLKYIDLRGCKGLTALPVSFTQLTELQYLDLSWCGNLQLEKDILEHITKLEKLGLHGCSELQQLPSGIIKQVYLRELDLSRTGLKELPPDIDRLAKLEVLEIGSGCLTSLPTSLENVSSLMKLRIKGCPELKCLPSLGNLSCLIELSIDGGRGLKHLPPVGCLTCLKHLKLCNLDVEYLPEGFRQLINLQTLEIRSCPIGGLPLANPEVSYANKPGLLNHVDSSKFKSEMLRRLKSIILEKTKVSTVSISEGCCPSLEVLDLSENHDLMEIETLPTTLKCVKISYCEKLKNIRLVAGLAELQDLEISNCRGLDELPSFAGLVELQRLWIAECPQLHELPSLKCCKCLEDLNIAVSSRVAKIDGLEELRSLKTLRLETSWKFPGITGLKNLDNLTTLQIIAESRSAIKTCIPRNVQKRPFKMHIVGRAVEDVESVVGSLSFPNFTLVDTPHASLGERWHAKSPLSNASCVVVCFVISCHSQSSFTWRLGSETDSYIPLRGGKQVYIAVCPEGFDLVQHTEGFELNDDFIEGSERVFLRLYGFGYEVEKGMAVIITRGQEGRALEAFHEFLEFLDP